MITLDNVDLEVFLSLLVLFVITVIILAFWLIRDLYKWRKSRNKIIYQIALPDNVKVEYKIAESSDTHMVMVGDNLVPINDGTAKQYTRYLTFNQVDFDDFKAQINTIQHKLNNSVDNDRYHDIL